MAAYTGITCSKSEEFLISLRERWLNGDPKKFYTPFLSFGVSFGEGNSSAGWQRMKKNERVSCMILDISKSKFLFFFLVSHSP